MALVSPLAAAVFIPKCRVRNVIPELKRLSEMSTLGSGASLFRDLGPALWVLDAKTETLSKDQTADIQGLLEWLQAGNTFLAYNSDRRYPKSDPTGATLGVSTILINSQAATNLIGFSGFPAGYVLNRGDMFDVSAVATSNLVLRSEDFGNAAWTKGNVTIDATNNAAPDATLTASKLSETAANDVHEISQAIAGLASSTTYTFSIFVKPLERTWIELHLLDKGGTIRLAYFHLTGAGAIGTTSGLVGASITAYANGYYRCAVSATTATGVGTPAIYLKLATADNTGSYAGSAGSGVLIWGAQLEAGSSPGRYVKTTSAGVTVAAAKGFHRILESATADGSGVISPVTIMPPLRNVPGWRLANFAIPTVEMQIVPGSVSLEPGLSARRLSFQAIEYIPAT